MRRRLRYLPFTIGVVCVLIGLWAALHTTNGVLGEGTCGSVVHPRDVGGSICSDHHMMDGITALFFGFVGLLLVVGAVLAWSVGRLRPRGGRHLSPRGYAAGQSAEGQRHD